MQKFTFVSLLCLTLLTACGYGARYAVSHSLYQGGEEFDVTPEEKGLDYATVEFQNTDGDVLHGWIIPGKEGYPLVIYFHGNISNLTHGLEKIELLNSLGFSVFSFEYRGYGKSKGRVLYEDDFYRDARSALWWLRRHDWNNNNIVYYGHSLGASVALNLALEEPPAGIILESAFTSYAEMFKYKVPYIYMFGGWKVREFNNITKISKISSPVILFHGTADEIVPWRMSQELYGKAPKPKRIHLVEGASHVNAFELATGSLASDLEWFLPKEKLSVSTQ